MAQEVLVYISLIIAIAAFCAVIARFIRQPPIIAYLIAGIIVGPLFLNFIGTSSEFSDIINIFAHIGVAFLLFIVGLSLDLRVLKEVGGVSTFAGIAEIILTGGIGFLIALGIGFGSTSALYIGAALAFSSTVVVVKILSDKREIDTLHGRIALGILIVEDFVAAIALMVIPLLDAGGNLLFILKNLGLVIALILAILIGASLVLNRFMNHLARNQEALFLFGIAWALVLATLFDYLGFSLEIGALIAGMSLASSKYTLELGGKIKPLRDFFVVLFFVFFGSQLAGEINGALIKQAILFSLFVIIGKPLIVMTVLRIAGYKKRTNFLAGSSLAQISEFSLILVLLGFTLGHLNQEIMSLAVMIAIITIGVSSYSIYYAHGIFNKISHLLGIFENRKHRIDSRKRGEEHYDIILFGYHRIGFKVLQTLKKMNKTFVVVDYNPKVVLSLSKEGLNTIYGDAGDKDLLTELPLHKAKLIISTIPEESANLILRERLKEIGAKATFIATAEQPRGALDLYKEGIDYVLIPHHLGGDYASHMIEEFGTDRTKYKEKGKIHKHDLLKAKNNSNFL
ncbi:cation:proton antiporter [Candidatus Pacearchaeota archaeon]|nr:cation:proton antiporter [Candidatus Pacearchaeota archaeon]